MVPDGRLADEELVARARAGDGRALDSLLLRYRDAVRARARGYFLVGADHEDVVQEGMIGLYKAIRDFAPGQASFRTFAEVCVSRQIVSAVRSATRSKHAPLNHYVPFHHPVPGGDRDDCTLGDILPAPPHTDPAEQVVSTERVRALGQHCCATLSDLEAEVLRLHVDGRSYREIARMLRRHTRSVDNALQRVKRKVDAHVAGWEAEVA